MPWRSRVGFPFGDAVAPTELHDQASEASEFEGWDTDLVEAQTTGIFGEISDAEQPFGGESAAGSHDDVGSFNTGLHMEVISTGIEPTRKRPLECMSLANGAGLNSSLFFGMVKMQKTVLPKQPWELGCLEGHHPCSPWLAIPNVGKRESLLGLTPVQEPPEKTAIRTPFHYRRLLTTRLAQTDDQLRAKAMRRLRDLILVEPQHTQLGRALPDTSGQLLGQDKISGVFADAFRNRATSTLKRSLDYYKLAVWLQQQLGLYPMQLSESVVYQYLDFLRSSSAAPTSADWTVKAIWFMHATAVIIDFHPANFSSRISGVCRDMFMRKRVLKQASPFPVPVVRSLEEYALLTDCKADSFFTNFILFCIYSSCRIGDASKIREVQFSKHQEIFLVEASTTEAKNTNSMERRRMLLPFSAMGWGVFPNPWCIKWKLQLEEMKPETIMPAFSEVTGTFLSRRLTTAEANMWLKAVLMRAGLTQAQACKYSTHSCKATVPTWAGKFGGFSMDERRLLTHHMEAGALMPLTYSRDNVTSLQSRVFRMLTAIRNGEFSPDDSNAKRIFRENLDLFPERDEPLEWTGDWADSESDVSGDENFMEGSYFMGGHHIPAEDISGDKLVHKDSMVVHLKRDLNTLWCGRRLSTNYRKWEDGDPDFSQLLVCQQCERSQP
eukprot:s2147_g9.t1